MLTTEQPVTKKPSKGEIKLHPKDVETDKRTRPSTGEIRLYPKDVETDNRTNISGPIPDTPAQANRSDLEPPLPPIYTYEGENVQTYNGHFAKCITNLFNLLRADILKPPSEINNSDLAISSENSTQEIIADIVKTALGRRLANEVYDFSHIPEMITSEHIIGGISFVVTTFSLQRLCVNLKDTEFQKRFKEAIEKVEKVVEESKKWEKPSNNTTRKIFELDMEYLKELLSICQELNVLALKRFRVGGYFVSFIGGAMYFLRATSSVINEAMPKSAPIITTLSGLATVAGTHMMEPDTDMLETKLRSLVVKLPGLNDDTSLEVTHKNDVLNAFGLSR